MRSTTTTSVSAVAAARGATDRELARAHPTIAAVWLAESSCGAMMSRAVGTDSLSEIHAGNNSRSSERHVEPATSVGRADVSAAIVATFFGSACARVHA